MELFLKLFVLTTLLTLLHLNFASAHVSLTFPPARKFNLDYLDSIGSPPPCGMPKGLVKTSLISGSTFNVTWHLGYPHRGTHRLELLSANGTELYELASEEETNDPTAQRHQVTLPAGFECSDCIIRLKRQSGELGNPYFWFWSCGDVEIVAKEKYTETCSGHGKARADGICGCRSGFWGKRCQYEDECRKDEDCGGFIRGNCIDLGGTNLPRRQCFCEPGFLGKKCSRTNKEGKFPIPNPKTLTVENLSQNYLNLDLEERVHLYWRLIEGDTLQMEFILRVNGTSYVGLGWRPLNFYGDCTRYPLESIPSNSIESRPRRSRRQTTSTNSSANKFSSEKAKITINSNETETNVPPKRRPEPPRIHPMSCADVVIGAAKGNLSRVLDYWSGDISTPKEDSLWDGSDDIQAAAGWETLDGITTIVFRKKVFSDDINDRFNDWGLDGPSLIIWARGQEQNEYVHRLPSGVDRGQPASVPNYYTQDEIKYHGARGQRGAFSTNFLGDGAREYFLSRPFNE